MFMVRIRFRLSRPSEGRLAWTQGEVGTRRGYSIRYDAKHVEVYEFEIKL
jgi:hypothetical protein